VAAGAAHGSDPARGARLARRGGPAARRGLPRNCRRAGPGRNGRVCITGLHLRGECHDHDRTGRGHRLLAAHRHAVLGRAGARWLRQRSGRAHARHGGPDGSGLGAHRSGGLRGALRHAAGRDAEHRTGRSRSRDLRGGARAHAFARGARGAGAAGRHAARHRRTGRTAGRDLSRDIRGTRSSAAAW